MNFKQFSTSDNQWYDVPYYQHKTATDIITSLPAVLYPTGSTATVGLKGNMSQTGTPTPQNPVMPNGCGERTGNLANLYNTNSSQVGLTVSATGNMRIVINGTKTSGANIVPIKRPNIILPAGTYTVKIKMVSGEITGLTSDGVFFGINASTYGQRTTPGVKQIGEVGTRTFTLSEDTTITSFDITPSYGSTGAVFDNASFECWFYAGSDNKPYEPYGIKIPISSANTTTPVYLGEVETTRRIKKLVLTGEEANWIKRDSPDNTYQISYPSNAVAYIGMCSHFTNGGSRLNDIVSSEAYFGAAGFAARYDTVTTLDVWKAYLQAQYAAGTPVCVWYVLATEETAVVNEPLRKIGDYADTVSGISIPTIAGANSFDVLTTLKPSEVELTYTGWHDAEVKEWDGSEWQ